mmetsp:Transcript_44943/g.70452  ORF Transcript_44943/g.70452 Transcript_44943/m.70452 type:complete len:370 (-) Transcript_44943:170-1279(-)
MPVASIMQPSFLQLQQNLNNPDFSSFQTPTSTNLLNLHNLHSNASHQQSFEDLQLEKKGQEMDFSTGIRTNARPFENIFDNKMKDLNSGFASAGAMDPTQLPAVRFALELSNDPTINDKLSPEAVHLITAYKAALAALTEHSTKVVGELGQTSRELEYQKNQNQISQQKLAQALQQQQLLRGQAQQYGGDQFAAHRVSDPTTNGLGSTFMNPFAANDSRTNDFQYGQKPAVQGFWNQKADGHFESELGKRGMPALALNGMDQSRMKRPRFWTRQEHERFLEGLAKYHTEQTGAGGAGPNGARIPVGLGQGVAELIAAHVGTRTVAQVRSHAQKHFIKEWKMKNGVATDGDDASTTGKGDEGAADSADVE